MVKTLVSSANEFFIKLQVAKVESFSSIQCIYIKFYTKLWIYLTFLSAICRFFSII